MFLSGLLQECTFAKHRLSQKWKIDSRSDNDVMSYATRIISSAEFKISTEFEKGWAAACASVLKNVRDISIRTRNRLNKDGIPENWEEIPQIDSNGRVKMSVYGYAFVRIKVTAAIEGICGGSRQGMNGDHSVAWANECLNVQETIAPFSTLPISPYIGMLELPNLLHADQISELRNQAGIN